MKFHWEPTDIICGRFITKAGAELSNANDGWRQKWTYKIGFVGGSSTYNPPTETHGPSGVCLIAMTDGMVENPKKSKQEMADYLNEQEMIPCPHDWLISMLENLRDCYQNEF